MTHLNFELTCVDGGWGWGSTGAQRFMWAPFLDEQEAEAHIKKSIPGGWTYRLIGPVDRSDSLGIELLSTQDHDENAPPIIPEEL